MILSKKNINNIDIDLVIDHKLKSGEIDEILFIVPTKRKIRYLTREIISHCPGNVVSGLKIETIGSFAEKLLEEIEGNNKIISEEASILLLSHSFKRVKLKYFSQYKNEIPFGTLERVKNVITEYKRHGITPERLKTEAKKLTGSDMLKALDIAEVFDDYQKSLVKNNYNEIGDIYSHLISSEKKKFDESYSFLYPDSRFILINGFDEFTALEIEIINCAAEINSVELSVVFDYYKYNHTIFSHLNSCHDRLLAKGFKEIQDVSLATQNRFLNIVRANLSIKSLRNKEKYFQDVITQISASGREEEVELIAKEIKKLLISGKIEPEKICIAFNLIGNYSTIIRDRFNAYGIPFNLTDRLALSTSPPIKALLGFLEILENDYYYKNIFRAFSGEFLGSMGIEISDLLKTSFELKIISGYDNWSNKIIAAINELSSPEDQSYNNIERLRSYRKAISDLKKIYSQLKPFSEKLSPDEFKQNLLALIFKLDLPKVLLDAPSDIVENDAIAFNTFIKMIDEFTDLNKLEYGTNEKFSLHFYLNQLRTTSAFTRYNIPEKPGYGVQITTLNEIRGLNFDYLFIGGLNDGDLPTRFTPEVFFSGSFAKEEIRHQVEQRYLFYQALCAWKKKLYLSFPQTDGKIDLVQSSFLQDFNLLFEVTEISKNDFKDEIHSKEELLEFLGKISAVDRNKFKLPEENNVDIDSINRSIEIDKKRIQEPFGESVFTGHLVGEISDDLKSKLKNITEEEFSATQLETYAKCPYKYFVENILKLETVEEPVEELEAFEYGSLIHSVLYEFFTKLKEKEIVLSNCNEIDFKKAETVLFNIAEKKFDELKLNPEFSFYEREKLLGINSKRDQSLLYKFLEEERRGEPGYVPEFFELSFGHLRSDGNFSGRVNESISTDGLKLKGKIDRIDINRNEKTYKVIDYKLGGTKPTSEDLATGISLQLPLYLFAAKELIKREFGNEYKPAGAQIFSLKFNEKDFGKKTISLKSGRSKSEDIEQEKEAAEEMIKICLEMLSKFTTDISNGKFNLSTLKNREAKVCKFCDFKRICRIQEVD